jgi:hypothetical protein
MHELSRELALYITILLEGADLPPDDAITDFADETRFTQINNIARYASLFADIALKVSRLAERDSIDDSSFELTDSELDGLSESLVN